MELRQKTFEEQYLPEITQRFITRTEKYLALHAEEITEKLKQQVQGVVRLIVRVQESAPIEVGEIQIALLHSSVYMEKPQICISAYNARGILGEEILNVKYGCEWLFHEWEQYQKEIECKIEELNAQGCIRSEAVAQMMRRSMQHFIYILYALLKYTLREFEQLDGVNKLLMTEDMRITVGSYRDWSRTVYQNTSVTDIFNHDEKERLKYGVFEQAIYSEKCFEHMDLSHAKFVNCDFLRCTLIDVRLTDAVFTNCRFYDCNLKNVTFYGADFNNCTLKRNVSVDVQWEYKPKENEKVEDLYKDVTFVGCVNDNTIFERVQ